MNPLSVMLDLFLPRECHVCGRRLIAGEDFVCPECLSRLPLTHYEKYWANHTKVNSDLNPMEMRFAGQLPLVRACSPFFYTRDSSLASLIHDFKYRGFSRLATVLGRVGALSLKDSGLFDGVDVILPVPLHWTKRLRRGYNQTELIAQGVSEAMGIPVGKQLRAVRSHRTQTSLSSAERIANTQGIFALSEPDSLRGNHIMLLDDICTTGATLLAAGECVVATLGGNVRLSLFTLGVV